MELERPRQELRQAIEYVPTWVIVGVALCLGIGTTIGYQRIVITVAEKIGKITPDLCPGRLRRGGRDGDDRTCRSWRPARQHNPRSFLGRRREHVGQSIRHPDGNHPQNRACLGLDSARRDAAFGRALPLRPPRGRAVSHRLLTCAAPASYNGLRNRTSSTRARIPPSWISQSRPICALRAPWTRRA